jgi:dTDP-4-dehydrorhamnose reductase
MSELRVLILGGGGMLGHKLWQRFRERFDTWVTVRSSFAAYQRFELFEQARTIDGVDAADIDSVIRAVSLVRPTAIVNAIGIVKQLPSAQDPVISISINSLFPHRLAAIGRAAGARVVHVSTDCVFSGRRGGYTEQDPPDAEDLYGRSKSLGEITGPGSLTLRTSIVGRELSTTSGLMEWFLSQRGERIRGFTRAMFSGLTTMALADVLAGVLERHPELSGVHHLSSVPISKHDLLCLLRDAFAPETKIDPDSSMVLDRTLDGSRFRTLLGQTAPEWPEMVRTMAADPTPYEQWRSTYAAR